MNYLMSFINKKPRNAWLSPAIIKRLREELAKLGLTINEHKTKIVDFKDPKQSFPFLGFDYRYCKTRQGKDGILRTPRRQARIKLHQKIKATFKAKRGRLLSEAVEIINPILRGWVNYFQTGNSGRCFSVIKDWVQNKVRRHIFKAKKQRGFGWKRWSTEQLYQYTGLFNDYEIRYKR